jgi:myosin-7
MMAKGGTAEMKKRWSVPGVDPFHMIMMGECPDLATFNDIEEWEIMLGAMKVLNFSQDMQDNIFDLAAACLHMGQIEFEDVEVEGMPGSEISDTALLGTIAALLKLDEDQLSDGFVTQSLVTRGEVTVKQLDPIKAQDVTKAFCKAVYGKFFVDIVDFICKILFVAKKTESEFRCSIGVLDIFGFENFDINSFEQLCINYCNEALQQFFVHAIFKMEQMVYDSEKINWANISFTDNAPTLALIAEMPMNCLALVDEESKFPKGSDESLLEKLHGNHGKTVDIYKKPKSSNEARFGVHHFAGLVMYDIEGFLTRNRDTFSQDLVNAIADGENDYLKELFSAAIEVGKDSTKKSKTLGWQFKSSLDALMTTLRKCNPWFVRCVKPNHNKKPGEFDRELSLRQLRYSGMMETIRIRKAGYPIRHTFKEAIDRYRLLAPDIPPSTGGEKDKANGIEVFTRIIGAPSTAADGWQVGLSKLFIKDSHDQILEERRDDVFNDNAIAIQKFFRGALARKRFMDMRGAMTKIQSRFRTQQAKAKCDALANGFARLQATSKMAKLTASFRNSRAKVVAIQAYARGMIARDSFKQLESSVLKVQAVFRYLLAKDLVSKAEDEAEAERIKAAAIKSGLDEEEAERQKQEKMAELAAATDAEKSAAAEKAADALAMEDEFARAANADVDDSKMVDDMFGFVDDAEGGESGETNAFGFEGGDVEQPDEGDFDGFADSRVQVEDEDDISNYKFVKFAGTYFQGNANAYYIRRPIKAPLLNIKSAGDKQAAISVWVTILRFMGDMPEPKHNPAAAGGGEASIMGKMYKTLGRKSSKADINYANPDGGGMAAAPPAEKPKEKMSIKKKLISMTLRKKNKLYGARVSTEFCTSLPLLLNHTPPGFTPGRRRIR